MLIKYKNEDEKKCDLKFRMSKLTVETMSGNGALDALRAEWQALFKAADASPFLSWEWLSVWQQWLGSGLTPHLLCVRAGGLLVGLLPLGKAKGRFSSLGVRLLSFLGEYPSGADYLDILALPEYQQDVAFAIFDHLAQNVPFGVLDLKSMAADSPSLRLIEKRFSKEAGFRYQLIPYFICPQVDLETGWENVLKHSKRAVNYERRLLQLRKLDGFEYRTITNPEEAGAAFERFLMLHEARWAGKGGSSVTGQSVLQSFHRDVVVRLAHAGLLRFDEVWAEGACRASIYGIDDGKCYYFYNSGYDQTWKNKSPGLVLLGLSLENASKRGIKRYDFLRGSENYKFEWANTTRKTVRVQISTHNPLVSLSIAYERAQMTVHAAMKDMLPKSAVEFLRRWKRSRKHQENR